MEKIKELTEEQTAQIQVYRDRYFAQATSTEPADRPRAEAAARRLAEIGGVEVCEVIWVNSPEDVKLEYQEVWTSPGDSLRAMFVDSLRVSLWGSLMASLCDSPWDSLKDELWDSTWDSTTVGGSFWVSFGTFLWISVGNSFGDTGWICYHKYLVEVLGVECSDEHRELLRLHNEIAASCFGVWITLGKVILCERPATVEIKDGKLAGLTWRTKE